MLSAGWPTAVYGEYAQTPLHWAAWHGNVEMVRDLLAHGAPVEAEETQYGGTPLGWALHGSLHGWHRDKGDYVATLKALLDAGATGPGKLEGLDVPEELLEVLQRRQG
jgi:hypothetical protein